MKNPPSDPTAPDTGCPLTSALGALGGKWNLICIYWLNEAPRRFADLQRLMPEISHKVLTETLRNLELEGLVDRRVLSEMPPHVEYSLSPYGRTVLPLVEAVRQWGRSHLDRALPTD